MAGGAITLPVLEYTVPGAQIQLAGTYGLICISHRRIVDLGDSQGEK
jgi:hypothetical protein